MSLPTTKPSLNRLKSIVETQESRLKEGIRILNAAKRKGQSSGATSSGHGKPSSQTSEWSPLERVIGHMDDLLVSYKKYSSELERRLKKLEGKGGKAKKVVK
jgi:hypothetical protein